MSNRSTGARRPKKARISVYRDGRVQSKLYGPRSGAERAATMEQRRVDFIEAAGGSAAGSSAARSSSRPGSPRSDASPREEGYYENGVDIDNEDPAGLTGDGTRILLSAFLNDRRHNVFPSGRQRNRGERRSNARFNWLAQIDGLVDAFLTLKHSHHGSGAPQPVVQDATMVQSIGKTSAIPGCVLLIDLSGLHTIPVAALGTAQLNVALLRRGYLGATPIRPSIAFSVRTLLCFVHLKLRARTAKHNFIRMLCDLHNIVENRSLKDRFSDAIDAFNEVLRAVDARVDGALQRTSEWRMVNGCPACSYKCEGEEPLVFARQFMLDGNNSLKRWVTGSSIFDIAFPKQYLLSRDVVDECKDEVPRRRAEHGEHGADAAGSTSDTCADKWRNARPEGEKASAWEVLDETGIFVGLCGHGFVVLATDMWRSGELAKYPLAIVKKLIELFADEGVLQIGYDIGCAHSTTAANASFGDAVKRHVRFVVGSFHGHAHNRQCQLQFHPRYIVGSGREDFEGCERLFSVTNFFAGLVRHATAFHRHEDIESAFRLWDREKYLNMGSLLLSRLKSALAKIEEHQVTLAVAESVHNISDAQYTAWIKDELDYLIGESERVRPVQDDARSAYASALDDWWAACDDLQKLERPFIAYNPTGRDQRADRRWLAAQARVQRTEATLHGFEQRFSLQRWTRGSPEYDSARQGAKLREFEVALENLERAIISRVFELEKANLRATGYKLRVHIAKAIGRRSAALNTVLQKYNTAASAIQPPRRTFTIQEVLDISWLDDFPLLRHNIRDQPWARPDMRRRITAWAETKRAQEEIKRVRIESVRIRAWIRDEDATWNARVAALSQSNCTGDLLLAHEFDARAALLFDVHSKILADLHDLDALDGQQVDRKPGLRAGQPSSMADMRRPASRPRLAAFHAPLLHEAMDVGLNDPLSDDPDAQDIRDDEQMLGEEEQDELDRLLELTNVWSV